MPVAQSDLLEDVHKAAQRKALLPWTLVAKHARVGLRQIFGIRSNSQKMMEATMKDAPIEAEFPSLPCCAFALMGLCAASQTFLDLAGQGLEDLLGADLRRVPLHGLLPNAMNKKLNLEAWFPLERLHQKTFAGASRLKASRRALHTETLSEEQREQLMANAAEFEETLDDTELVPVTVSLLLSPGKEGKVFWNLVHAFMTEVKKEVLVVHVLMPIASHVPEILWQLRDQAVGPSPIPELLPYVDVIMQRLRTKLGRLQLQDAKQALSHEDEYEEPPELSPRGVGRRRASDLGPVNVETTPNLPTELLRVAMTRRFSEASLCSDLPPLSELWGGERSQDGTWPRALEEAEARCRRLLAALGQDFFSGIHFVPRFQRLIEMPFEHYHFWEQVLESESEELMAQWKRGIRYRSESFRSATFMLLDPDEIDCPISYISPGLEDLMGYWRAWALGRHFRFLLLPDALPNRVFNGTESARIEDFCYNQGKDQPLGAPEPASHLLSLLQLHSDAPLWCCLYLRHVWLQDPAVDHKIDFSVKHFIFVAVLPLHTQMPALQDLLQDALETNLQLTARLRQLLLEKTPPNVALTEKQAVSILDTVIPAWLLESGRGVPSCMVGHHFVPRLGLAALRDFRGLWPRIVWLLWKLPKHPEEEKRKPTLQDEEEGLPCWVADVRSENLPLVFTSRSLQTLTGFDNWALARNVQVFQPKQHRIDQAMNNEEPLRLKEFASQSRNHGDTMVSLLLLERRSGERFFALQQTFYLLEERSDRAYLLSLVNPIELKMPAVLASHQISELNEDEMGLALDEWGIFANQEREDPEGKALAETSIQKACEFYSARLSAFLRTCEDYEGDLFVPKIGLVEVHAFQGVLQPLQAELDKDLRRILELEEVDIEQVIMSVVDPAGEDYPLVWISKGFEEYTGYQHEWALGRNCRFLQPKDHERNQQFNGDQLAKLRRFSREGRKSMRPTITTTLALLLNERRNGSPFWNLSCYLHVEVLGKNYIVSVMLPFTQEPVRLAEMLSMDPEALEQQARLKALLARHEGGAKFTSLQAVVRQLFTVFFEDFPTLLQAPGLPAPDRSLMPILGLEVNANNTQAMASALKAGLRHVHIVLPSGPTTRASDGSAFVRKILPLKLAEVLNNLQRQHLHYLREAMVITVRTPPHLVFVLAEVRKTLATAGYTVACWFLDVRGCANDVAEHWQAISQAKAPNESLGLFGGSARLLNLVQAAGGAPVSICAVKVHPGKRPDEPELRLMSKLASQGILPMAFEIFGPQQSWLQTTQAQSASLRLGIAPSTLALKWAEHKGFLALVPELEMLGPISSSEHRAFMRLYREAPPVETCMAVLWGTTMGAIPSVAEAKPPAVRLPRTLPVEHLHLNLAKLQQVQAHSARRAPQAAPKEVRHQALPDMRRRAGQAQPGVVWRGETAQQRLAIAPISPHASPTSHLVEDEYCLPWPEEQELSPGPVPAALRPVPPKRPDKPSPRPKRPREVLIVATGDGPVKTEPDFAYESLFVSIGTK